jgi:hypothetical protein
MAAQILDQSALKFNQLSIVTLTVLGFILGQPVLPVLVALVLIGGTVSPNLALFKLIYRNAVKPLNLMKPDPIEDSPAPHEFAQLLGGIVLGIGSLFLIFGSAVVGWALAWVVIFLALANLLFGFCAGCFVYYQLGKLGVPGFTSAKQQLRVQR